MSSLTLRTAVLGLALGLLTTAAPGADEKKPDEKKVDDKIDLQVGDAAPKFDRRDEANKTWSTSDHYGKKWVVIYFAF